MLPTLLSVGSLLQSLPLCFVAILVDPGEEVASVLQVWMCSSRQGRDRPSSSNHLNVWQPRLTRSEAARVRTEMAVSAAELDRYLHRDD